MDLKCQFYFDFVDLNYIYEFLNDFVNLKTVIFLGLIDFKFISYIVILIFLFYILYNLTSLKSVGAIIDHPAGANIHLYYLLFIVKFFFK